IAGSRTDSARRVALADQTIAQIVDDVGSRRPGMAECQALGVVLVPRVGRSAGYLFVAGLCVLLQIAAEEKVLLRAQAVVELDDARIERGGSRRSKDIAGVVYIVSGRGRRAVKALGRQGLKEGQHVGIRAAGDVGLARIGVLLGIVRRIDSRDLR